MTKVRRQILLNIRQGRDPYDGFENSSYGGAIRSMQVWPLAYAFIAWDPRFECWKLTDAGARALESEL